MSEAAPAGSSRRSTAFVPHDLKAPVIGGDTGPLAGFTVAVKDMYDIAGERTGGGNPQWLEAHEPAGGTAAAVRSLLDAGATVIGKTVCDEFFFSITGSNAHYGTPVNPRAPGRLPGGSSSGSAAATAAGACDIGLGSDTGGSVRVPAALCGIYGIRPTHGRVSLAGAMGMAPTFDTAGWFAAAPDLLRKVGPVLLDAASARGLVRRLLMPTDAFAEADADVVALLNDFLTRAAIELPKPQQVTVAPDGFAPLRDCFRTIQGHEIWRLYGAWIGRHRPALGPGIKERLAYAARISAEETDSARAILASVRGELRRLIEPGTVMALPTVPCIAPLLDTPADALDKFRTRVMTLTCIAGLGGLPQVTLPVGLVEGCPVGLSFIGWVGGDEMLLDLAVKLAPYCGG